MTDDTEIWRIEELFWTGGEGHYSKHLAAEAIMVFPQSGGIMDRKAILEGMKAAPRWKSVEMADKMLRRADGETVTLAYAAGAERGGEETYRALCGSTYRRIDGAWRLVHHQHTAAQ